ncbi:putative importin 11 [Xylaria sp. FL1777]|nr:putative importin 11 [Xylaria sp. FL1777]
MEYAIEVSGAASPLGRVELCRTLQAASSSQDHHQRQAAGQQLESWQNHAEYYPALQAVFLDNTLPREIRFLAIIQLKNGIETIWRVRAVKKAIPPAGKHLIRSNLFRGSIEERDSQLALHNALVVAKIIRIDFPDQWPDALDSLVSQVKTLQNDNQSLAGALLILLQVVKELGSARLMKSQKALHAVIPELVQVLTEIYHANTSLWFAFVTGGQGDERNAVAAMGISLTTFKTLRRLLITGYDLPHKDAVAQQIWALAQMHFQQLLPLRNENYPAIRKHLLQFTKLHIQMSSMRPGCFALLPGSAELISLYWNLVAEFSLLFGASEGTYQGSASIETETSAERPFMEEIALKGLLLMRDCQTMIHRTVQSTRYSTKEDVMEQQKAISLIKSQIFSDEFISQIAHTITTRLLVLRKVDMEAWEDDPEEWERKAENQSSAYHWEVRPCAERLLLDLLIYYKDLLLKPLLAYFTTVQDPEANITTKEAVYTTMGLAAPLVAGSDFDFDALLKSVIATDAVRATYMCQVLRRRIAILLSQWVPVKISDETRPLVYEIFRHFLNSDDPHNDIVVRITAARQFKLVVDDFDFDHDGFVIQAPYVLKELINLIQIVEVEETKLAIVDTLRGLISRMDNNIAPFSDLVMHVLPNIWSSASSLDFMMKQAVLEILQSLVVAMKTEFQRYQHLVLPLIVEATQEGTDNSYYLHEEVLNLWLHLLQNAQSPLSSGLISLASVGIEQLASQNYYPLIFIKIVGCYITLAPQSLLEDYYRKPLLKSLLACLETKSREQVALVKNHIELFLYLSHRLGGDQGFQTLMRDVVETGFLKHLLEGIHDVYEAHQTSGPKKRWSHLDPHNLAGYLTMLSRIAFIDPSTFIAMLGTLGPIENLWDWLSDEWFLSFDSMVEPDQLKLNLLGITRLLELPQPMAGLCIRKLQHYLAMWTSVIYQIWDDDRPGHDRLYDTKKLSPAEWDTNKDIVERELYITDPVHTIVSYTFVKERLQGLAQIVGEQMFQEWWANVDKDVLAGFQDLENKSSASHGVNA